MKNLGTILFILVIVYFIFLIRQDIINNLGLKAEVRQVAKKLTKETSLAVDLKEKIVNLNRPDYLEKLGRVRLGMIKKGETAYKVIGR